MFNFFVNDTKEFPVDFIIRYIGLFYIQNKL